MCDHKHAVSKLVSRVPEWCQESFIWVSRSVKLDKFVVFLMTYVEKRRSITGFKKKRFNFVDSKTVDSGLCQYAGRPSHQSVERGSLSITTPSGCEKRRGRAELARYEGKKRRSRNTFLLPFSRTSPMQAEETSLR